MFIASSATHHVPAHWHFDKTAIAPLLAEWKGVPGPLICMHLQFIDRVPLSLAKGGLIQFLDRVNAKTFGRDARSDLRMGSAVIRELDPKYHEVSYELLLEVPRHYVNHDELTRYGAEAWNAVPDSVLPDDFAVGCMSADQWLDMLDERRPRPLLDSLERHAWHPPLARH